jgi:hypothetical protein
MDPLLEELLLPHLRGDVDLYVLSFLVLTE